MPESDRLTLVLGLGNPLRTDDAVGLRVAARLRTLLDGRTGVDVDLDYQGGLRTMERMIGYRRAIVVDALRSADRAPGTVRRLRGDLLPARHCASAHDVDLNTALGLGRRAGLRLPEARDVIVIGIVTEDVDSFGEECTPEVEAAVPGAVAAVLDLLQDGACWPPEPEAARFPLS